MSENTPEKFTTEELEETSKTFRIFIDFFRDLVIILFIVIIIRSVLVTPFRINGSSMEPSYHDREYILVDKLSYLNFTEDAFGKSITNDDSFTSNISNKWNTFLKNTVGSWGIKVWDPKRWDVVVITPHVDKSREYYIKRVIGLPWESIRFQSGIVSIKKVWAENFIHVYEPYLSLANSGHTYLQEYIEGDEFKIPDDMYWIMGDNRNNSADSRSCFRNCFWAESTAHFIKRRDIIGHVLLNFGYINIFSADGIFDGGKWSWTYPPRLLNHPRNATYKELAE